MQPKSYHQWQQQIEFFFFNEIPASFLLLFPTFYLLYSMKTKNKNWFIVVVSIIGGGGRCQRKIKITTTIKRKWKAWRNSIRNNKFSFTKQDMNMFHFISFFKCIRLTPRCFLSHIVHISVSFSKSFVACGLLSFNRSNRRKQNKNKRKSFDEYLRF